MKKYTIRTDDDRKLLRAAQADSLAFVLCDIDQQLRNTQKHGEGMASEFADYWRTTLYDIAADHGIVIDGLFE